MRRRDPRRFSLRARLTLVSALVFAVALTAIGSLLYFQTKTNLDTNIDSGLDTRAASLAALTSQPRRMPAADDDFQLLSRGNAIVASSAPRADASLLTRQELSTALAHPIRLWRGEDFRVLAIPTADHSQVIVVQTPLHQREHALEGLARSLIIGGIAALAVAAALGYWLARHALAPVEQMRERADQISQLDPDLRLPLPPARDEIHRLGETLNTMLDRLDAASEHERRFIADASHELRTPLGRLRIELELARTENDPASLHAAIDSALDETEHLTLLADDLLTLAALDDDTGPKTSVPCDLADIVHAAVAATVIRDEPASSNITVDLEAATTVEGDPIAIQRAVQNLLDNAIKYGKPPVQISIRHDADKAVVTVRDHGSGFDKTFIPTAFDRFSRAGDTYRTPGTGLGLALVQAIAEQHGGAAHIDNQPDGGAIATFVLARS